MIDSYNLTFMPALNIVTAVTVLIRALVTGFFAIILEKNKGTNYKFVFLRKQIPGLKIKGVIKNDFSSFSPKTYAVST